MTAAAAPPLIDEVMPRFDEVERFWTTRAGGASGATGA